MSNYVLVTEARSKRKGNQWWLGDTVAQGKTAIFSSFDEANAEMRKSIKELVEGCSDFPYAEDEYTPLKTFEQEMFAECECDEDDFENEDRVGLSQLSAVISSVVKNEETVFADKVNLKFVDDYERYYAFVGSKDSVVANNYDECLKFNCHKMKKKDKDYYFEFSKTDDYDCEVAGISVKLLYIE